MRNDSELLRRSMSVVAPLWSLSIVSHGHLESVRRLLADLARFHSPGRFEIILTINDQDADPVEDMKAIWPGSLTLVRNPHRKGFAANHNSAVRLCRGQLIAILDADLCFSTDPFAILEQHLANEAPIVASATIVNAKGEIEDNARNLITPVALLRRYLFGGRHRRAESSDDREVDWIAGLFMATTRENFDRLDGFDERYFLYCEDADLCVRAWNRGFRVLSLRTAPVVHEARRMSVRRPRHFFWHASSLIKHWTSAAFWTYLRRPASARNQ